MSASLTAVQTSIACLAIEEAIRAGVEEFIVCPSKRNAPLVVALTREDRLQKFYFYEERSAAFYALGRSRATGKPVAVLTTSGTAVGELLPAAMEAYYTGVPLLLITGDRPRHYRGKNAPQSCEQVGIFSCYAPYALDVAEGEEISLATWDQRAPAHLNVCFEEPNAASLDALPAVEIPSERYHPSLPAATENDFGRFYEFLAQAKNLCVIVSALPEQAQASVAKFLKNLQAPVYLEGISGIREEPALQGLRISNTVEFWERTARAGYEIDSVLRIGGVPTVRLWRDLESRQNQVRLFSVNEVPFAGISWADDCLCTSLDAFFAQCHAQRAPFTHAQEWLASDAARRRHAVELFERWPAAEPSLMYHLSKVIPVCSTVYLGNSLPIREWDLAATDEDRGFSTYASRGLNGIDGQISAFLGVCRPDTSNWGIIGDLTALYDFAGPWALMQKSGVTANLVVINNGGGKIFDRMFPQPEFQNCHTLSFASFAQFWGLAYEAWDCIPKKAQESPYNRLVEVIPDPIETRAFWEAYNKL